MTEEYNADIKCQNCRIINYLRIPRGTTIQEYAEETENPVCRVCDCPVIKIKEEKKEKKE